MSKAQLEELKTLTSKSFKLLKQFIQELYEQIKKISQAHEAIISNNDQLSSSKSLSEQQSNVSQLESYFNAMKNSLSPLLSSMRSIYNEINTSDHFPQKLQQDTVTLQYCLSIPNRITIIESYSNLLGNIIKEKQYNTNITSKIELINNMLTNTIYKFKD